MPQSCIMSLQKESHAGIMYFCQSHYSSTKLVSIQNLCEDGMTGTAWDKLLATEQHYIVAVLKLSSSFNSLFPSIRSSYHFHLHTVQFTL